MPRALTALVVTVVAVFLLVSFKVSPHAQKGRLVSVTPARAAPAPAPASGAGQPPARSQASGGSAPAKSAAPAVRRVNGAVVSTEYGDVQVAVTLRGRRITNVRALALPFDRSRSQEISSAAAPILRSEVLQAQSAQIDIVSGATYTSEGYAQSLQAALDKARG